MKPQINYQKWFEASKNKGFEALEILSHASKRLSTTLQNKKITDFNQKDIINFTIKGLYKDKKSWVDIEKINDNMINEILDILKNQIEITNNKEKDFIFEGSLNYPQIKLNNDDFSKIPNQQKNDLFIQLEKELKKQCKYFQKINSICFDECEIEDKIINSKGLKLQTKENVIFISTSCDFYYKETKKEQNVRKVFWEKNFKNINITKYAKMISQKQNQIDEQSVKSNVYPVVFANNAFANLLNSFYNFFNALNIHYNNMQIKNQLNQMIASSKVTIIDDPLHPEAFYKYKFDYEGVACQKKNIITKGILKNFIHNLQTAHIFQTEAKGNYFNNDNCMTNCYLQKGTKTLKEIIAPIKNGIYINFLIGLDTGGINMINGDFNLEASGFKIINGEIKYPTEMFIIKGNFLDILKNIKDIASDDFTFQNDVGFGSASVYVGDIFINGE